MSRPWALVCLLLFIVFTSHFDWKQQYGNEVEASANASEKLKYFSGRDDTVKEKVSIHFHCLSFCVFRWKLLLFYLILFNLLDMMNGNSHRSICTTFA